MTSAGSTSLPEVIRLDCTPEELRVVHALVCTALINIVVERARAAGANAQNVRTALELSAELMLGGSIGVLGDDGMIALKKKTLQLVNTTRCTS